MKKNIETMKLISSAKEAYINSDFDLYDRALQECIEENDAATAKTVIRKKRDELLQKTDARMCLDRLGLTTPTYTLTGLIEFVRTIMKALTGDWAKYRQALRDIPDQPGFPFSVVWPEEPED